MLPILCMFCVKVILMRNNKTLTSISYQRKMITIKTSIYLVITILILSSIILITSCTSGKESLTMQTDPVSGEGLFQQGQNQERLSNYSDAIQLYERVIIEFPDSSYANQAYESIPRCHYYWGLQLEEMGQYGAEQTGGAIEQYNQILQEYPNSQYALKLKRLTEDDPEIEMIASVEFDINSHFRGSVINESSYYIVELVIYIQLYQDINQVYYNNIVLNGIEPGEEGSFEEYPWVPLHGWDNLIWSFTEVWLRVI